MTTVMVLQARMASTRLPGKVLKQAAGRSVLEWVIEASRMTQGIDKVVVAVPDGSVNQPVVNEALRCGAIVTRGSETDVLDRFLVAAETVSADTIMRVTTDCPLSDPLVNSAVLLLLQHEQADYACNNEPFSFPHGLDCEAFTISALRRAATEATEPYDREHVTPWIKRHPTLNKSYLTRQIDERSVWRWTVDHPDDFRFFESIAARLGERLHDWQAVSDLLERYPDLHEINRHCRQR